MKVGSNLCLKRKLATASCEVQMRSLLEDPLESDSDGSHPESGGKGEVEISNLKTGRAQPCQFEARKSEFGI